MTHHHHQIGWIHYILRQLSIVLESLESKWRPKAWTITTLTEAARLQFAVMQHRTTRKRQCGFTSSQLLWKKCSSTDCLTCCSHARFHHNKSVPTDTSHDKQAEDLRLLWRSGSQSPSNRKYKSLSMTRSSYMRSEHIWQPATDVAQQHVIMVNPAALMWVQTKRGTLSRYYWNKIYLEVHLEAKILGHLSSEKCLFSSEAVQVHYYPFVANKRFLF